MAASTEPNSGLFYGWSLGESGWNTGMDANLLKMGRVGMHLSVIDRDLTSPPVSPADGDRYIVGAGASDSDWGGQDGNIAVWDDSAGAWVFYEPNLGWTAYIEDEQVISAFKADSTGWSAGVSI